MTPLWNSLALAFQLPEGVALPSWWQHAEALGWSHETCASAAQLTAPRSRRVYGEGDRFEVTQAEKRKAAPEKTTAVKAAPTAPAQRGLFG